MMDPAALTTLPKAFSYHSGSGIGSLLYVMGGKQGSSRSKDSYEFWNDSWVSIQPMLYRMEYSDAVTM